VPSQLVTQGVFKLVAPQVFPQPGGELLEAASPKKAGWPYLGCCCPKVLATLLGNASKMCPMRLR